MTLNNLKMRNDCRPAQSLRKLSFLFQPYAVLLQISLYDAMLTVGFECLTKSFEMFVVSSFEDCQQLFSLYVR